MAATIIDGKGIADAVLANVREQVDALGVPVHLAAVCIGDDAGIRGFVKVKQKAAQSVGIQFSSYFFGVQDHEQVRETMAFLAADDGVHGIFVELPLPEGWDRASLFSLIPPEKDVDALTEHPPVPAPAVKALQYVLHEMEIEPSGKHAAVIGQGALIGRPVAQWLRDAGATVDVIDVGTTEPAAIVSRADIVISGAGVPGLVTGEWIKGGALVVDYGYAKKGDAFVGDVDAADVQKKAGFVTPVPGGMGPLVVAAVLENVVELATR